jgi:hypothetical protein
MPNEQCFTPKKTHRYSKSENTFLLSTFSKSPDIRASLAEKSMNVKFLEDLLKVENEIEE